MKVYSIDQKKNKMPALIEPGSTYVDVKHLEDTTTREVAVVDTNDVKYSAISATRSAPVSLL